MAPLEKYTASLPGPDAIRGAEEVANIAYLSRLLVAHGPQQSRAESLAAEMRGGMLERAVRAGMRIPDTQNEIVAQLGKYHLYALSAGSVPLSNAG